MSFTIIHNNIDYTLKLKGYAGDTASISITPTVPLYIGLYKPFNNLFVAFKVPDINLVFFDYQYFDGINWVSLNVSDESKNFKKDGFIYFKKPVYDTWKKFSIGGVDEYFIQAVPSVDTSLVEIKGISVMLSNDSDLEGIRSNIVSKHNNGETWLLKTEAAKKFIVQSLRNRGHTKIKNILYTNHVLTEGSYYSDITEFDLLEPFELRMASTYKTLSMIYLDELSDEAGDKWERQGIRYDADFTNMVEVFLLKLDLDDDGHDDFNDNILGAGIDLIIE